MSDDGVEIIGPFQRSELVVGGWSVPFVEVQEETGGTVAFTIDKRLMYHVSAGDFEDVARLVANAIAVAVGMPSHPGGELSPAERQHYFRHVSHRCLAPSRMTAIGGVEYEDAPSEPPDDPRFDDV